MNRIEYEIDLLEEKIARAKRDYNEARQSLSRELDDAHEIIRPVFVQQYANKMAEAYNRLENLNEQLCMLRFIQKEQQKAD